MQEQAGIYKVTLIENKDISIIYQGENISQISGGGQSIELDNEQEIVLEFTPQRGKNSRLLFQYQLNYKAFDLSKETKTIINSIKKSIYGWLACIEFYDTTKRIITSPLKFSTGNINNNTSNHYEINLVNSVFGQKMINFTDEEQAWILDTGVWNSTGIWLSDGIWNA